MQNWTQKNHTALTVEAEKMGLATCSSKSCPTSRIYVHTVKSTNLWSLIETDHISPFADYGISPKIMGVGPTFYWLSSKQNRAIYQAPMIMQWTAWCFEHEILCTHSHRCQRAMMNFSSNSIEWDIANFTAK